MALPKRLTDLAPGDVVGRTLLNQRWYEDWRDRYPERAEWLDANPPKPQPICDTCQRRRPNVRVYDWSRLDRGEDPVIGLRCRDCRKTHGTPTNDRPLDQDAITRLRAAGIAKPDATSVATGPPPGYRVEGNTAYKLDQDAREPAHPDLAALIADDEDTQDLPRRGSKLDSWFFPPDEE